MENISASQAAKLLGISIDNLHLLKEQGLLHTHPDARGVFYYSAVEIQRIKSRNGPTLTEEAAFISVGIQRQVVSSVSFTKKVFIFVAGVLTGYAFLVAVFTVMLIWTPLQTARWLGIIKTELVITLATDNHDPRVLGVDTSNIKTANTPAQTLLQPVSRASLAIARSISPSTYEQISQVTILDTNDVLELDANGDITPVRPIRLPETSLLQVGDDELIQNLNSQYLQGRQPGTNVGDLAIVGEGGQISGLSIPSPAPQQFTTVIQNIIVSPAPSPQTFTNTTTGLTNENLSGSAGITNANLANSLIKVQAGSGIALSGDSVSLGGTLTISASGAAAGVAEIIGTANQILVSTPTGVITLSLPQDIAPSSTPSFGELRLTNSTNQLVFGTTNTGTLTWNPTTNRVLTLPDATDTLVGLATMDVLTNKTINAGLNTLSGLTALNFTAGDFSSAINTGTYAIDILGTAASVSGVFAGDVTGTQGATVLTSVGTPGTYGSGLSIPVFTTDTKGRVTSVTDTTIAGLTNAHLSGTAGITNANLANSSLSLAGNSGSGSVSLGGILSLAGSGITNVSAAGSAFTITSTEADTLQSVYERGNTITTTTGNGVIIDSTAATVTGTVTGLQINAPTTLPGSGTYHSLSLGTSTSSTANSYDAATIAVGNISSTAQQNFATLNITNGGSGFLDVELIRGFINFQNMNTLYEDFTSRSLDTADRWTSTSTGTGSNCNILAGGLNGLFRMHSGGGINRGCELTTQSIGTLVDGYYQRGNNPIFETKLKVDVVTNARVFVGFTEERVPITSDVNPDTNHAYIAKRSTDTTWQCITDDGGATETVTDTGVTIVANTFYRLRVELRNGTTPETICTIDNGTTVTRTVVTATQPTTTSPMDIYLKLNQSDTLSKNMDIDYVRAWQDDPPVEGLAVIGEPSSESEIFETGTASQENASASADISHEEPVDPGTGGITKIITDVIQNVFKNLVEFFDKVIFHSDVTFLGHTTFNKDTAGHAMIKAGQSEVSVNFEKEYAMNPVVTASINLVGGITPDEPPSYAVYETGTRGFKIKLSRITASDLYFSWIALAVDEGVMSINSAPTEVPSVSPSVGPEGIQDPVLETNPTPVSLPSPTPPQETPMPLPQLTPHPSPGEETSEQATESAQLEPEVHHPEN